MLIPDEFTARHKADLVVNTSDDAHLFVVKSFLTYASPFFDNLLIDSSPDETYHDLPVYRSAEDCRTMCAVLRLCYPLTIDPHRDFAEASVVLALRKYMMEGAETRLRETLSSPVLLEEVPLRVFSIARHCGWDDLARCAARATLRFPFKDLIADDELSLITGLQYHRLYQYYENCRKAAMESLSIKKVNGSRNVKLPVLYIRLRINGPPPDGLVKSQSCPQACDRTNANGYNSSQHDPPLLLSRASSKSIIESGYYAHKWVPDFVKTAQGKVGERPGADITSHDVADQALGDAVKQGCSTQTTASVRAIIDLISKNVKAAIDGVELEACQCVERAGQLNVSH